MQKIVPHLWFNDNAVEAAKFYVSAFTEVLGESPQDGGGSAVRYTSVIRDTPSGDCDFVSFRLQGFEFMAISGGPAFAINPSISFMINFDPSMDPKAREHLDSLWAKLSDGGTALMPLDTYPFSERYGWIKDKFGLSWQLILTNPQGAPRPFIIPSMMFTGDITGKADEAIEHYVSSFNDSKRGISAPYPPGASPEPSAKLMFADFMLEGQWFAAMDSGHMHTFGFNEAVSLLVRCIDQADIDAYWRKLSAVPAAEQCGWIKDKYGLSWQISPVGMEEILSSGDDAAIARVMKAFLTMKKVDLAMLQKAYKGQ